MYLDRKGTWRPNQFRPLLGNLAYVLMSAIRRLGLAGTDMAHAQCATYLSYATYA